MEYGLLLILRHIPLIMKTLSLRSLAVAALIVALVFPSCKTKKELPKPAEQAEVPVKRVLPVEQKKPETTDAVATVAPVVEKPDYNFSNLQFEFNSAILKTSSYPMLDRVAMEMKKGASVKFRLNGYASAEGTPEHNMELSEQRATAVKTYLLNAGVTDEQVNAKGFGETNAIKPNTTEDNRALNRRVEIKKI
jgi:OOP family OmpA-OmpF porin